MDETHSIGQTHSVFNQPPARTGVNEFVDNPVLCEFVQSIGRTRDVSELETIGAVVGSAEFARDARLANANPPVLLTHDPYGHRIDEVEYHPSYHRILAQAVRAGAHTAAWGNPGRGASAHRAAKMMLFAQLEPGHACPISMSHAAVEPLQNSPVLAQSWLPRLLARSYDPSLHAGKPSALIGMAMTEKQGGSDVRANTTVAVSAGDHQLLTGHKWFCSAPMSDAFLVLAKEADRQESPPSCFLLPRVLPDGTRNVFRIQRLKDKLGNRSNASCEVEFANSTAFRVGEPERGVAAIMGMVARTRLDCVLGTAAGMRQGIAEALWHTRHRSAFGRKLVDQPIMTNVLADLALESEAATATALRLACAYDDDVDKADDVEVSFRRLATAVAKYWVCKRGPGHAYEAMECLGGNGYTEAFPLAMRYREQPVLAIWEGAGNVVALDVLRTMGKEPKAVTNFLAELGLAHGSNRIFDNFMLTLLDRVTAFQRSLPEHEGSARALVEQLALGLQASLLIRYSPASVSEAFVESRLGQQRCFEYGTLPAGSDLSAILQRQ
ncbi:acyl-CoA dehydrogenase family protein [Paeniglutamicibacter antarcticus]|uniref:Acyl-CoA dehydrogenase family protein n=1 Tax=Arthrobacter terrae TaxID=2935737 RepID=A0A931CRM6_9MICC|nr:acyl-CoA dehydrogenase family protein [Arthrobacter terrae]